MKTPKLIAAGVLLVSLILVQACSTARSSNSRPENTNNSNQVEHFATTTKPRTSKPAKRNRSAEIEPAIETESFETAPPPVTTSQCDPNYSGCVPIASDVDCAGGNGNGPAYVKGPVRVIGRDIYKLDGDGDGIGCE